MCLECRWTERKMLERDLEGLAELYVDNYHSPSEVPTIDDVDRLPTALRLLIYRLNELNNVYLAMLGAVREGVETGLKGMSEEAFDHERAMAREAYHSVMMNNFPPPTPLEGQCGPWPADGGDRQVDYPMSAWRREEVSAAPPAPVTVDAKEGWVDSALPLRVAAKRGATGLTSFAEATTPNYLLMHATGDGATQPGILITGATPELNLESARALFQQLGRCVSQLSHAFPQLADEARDRLMAKILERGLRK